MIPDWMARAACTGADDPDAWFPGKAEDVTQRILDALATCRACPVRNDCLQYALDEDIPLGIFGGVMPSQRRALAVTPRLPRKRSERHGERACYLAGCHCEPCTEANRVYQRNRTRFRDWTAERARRQEQAS